MSTESEAAELQIQIGDMSFTYKGNQQYIENGFLDAVKQVLEMRPPQNGKVVGAIALGEEPAVAGSPAKNLQHATTNTIASLTDTKTGPDLVVAAVTHLQLVKGQEKALRSDILEEMKSATTYYKDTFSGNLSSYLDSLVKTKRLNMVAPKTFALTAAERQKLENLLATQ
jgi:hypothetical protein